jgi:TM2 domain-containing membrane protein YozV
MKAVGVLVNIFLPGVGTIIVGKAGQGIAQILLYLLGILLSFTVVGAIIGVPLCIAVWIWAIVSAATSEARPMQIVVQQNVTHGVASHAVNPPAHGAYETVVMPNDRQEPPRLTR